MDFARNDLVVVRPLTLLVRRTLGALCVTVAIMAVAAFGAAWLVHGIGLRTPAADVLKEELIWFLPLFLYLCETFWLIDAGRFR